MKKLFAAALAAASFQALASLVGATAQLNTREWRLIDLTPDDGVAASVQWHTNPTDVLTQTRLLRHGEVTHEDRYATDSFAPSSAGAFTHNSGSSAMISGGPSFSALATGWAMPDFKGFTAYTALGLDYTLGASSALEWIGSYSVQAWTTGGQSIFDKAFAHVTYGDATKLFSVVASPWDGKVNLDAGLLTYRVDNAGASAMDGEVFFKATVTGGQLGVVIPAAPIPEPGTWALMAGGLLAVGWVAKRRNA